MWGQYLSPLELDEFTVRLSCHWNPRWRLSPNHPPPLQAFSLPSARLKADRTAGEARNSPLLPVGTGSGKQAGTGGWSTTFSRDGEPHSRRMPWHPALLEELVSRAWLPAPGAGGVLGVGAWILSVSRSSFLLFWQKYLLSVHLLAFYRAN